MTIGRSDVLAIKTGDAIAVPSSARPAMPERIGRFRVVERIGRGAMGIVYSARNIESGRPVAIKLMMADLEGDRETRVRFEREARVGGEMLHRNVINVYEMGEEDGRLYFVMELLDGETLGDYLRRVGKLPLERRIADLHVTDGPHACPTQLPRMRASRVVVERSWSKAMATVRAFQVRASRASGPWVMA